MIFGDFSEEFFPYSPAVRIRYLAAGSGPRPVVLVHGFGACSATWTDLVSHFDPTLFRLYLVDLKGSGGSSKPRDRRYALTDHAEILAALVAHLDLQGAVLAGHSMGGAVVLVTVLQLQAEGSRRAAGAALLSAPLYPQKLPAMFRLLKVPLAGGWLLRLVPGTYLARRGLEIAYFDRRLADAAHITRYAPCYCGATAWPLAQTARSILPSDCDLLTSRYSAIALPLLLLWGRHDRIVPVWQGERFAAAVPAATLRIFEECGHNPHEERPAETAQALLDFISSLPPSPSPGG